MHLKQFPIVQLNRSIFWNGLIEQWKIINDINTKTVTFPIAFTINEYFAVGVIYNSGGSMTSTVYESQVFPSVYDYQSVTFGNTTSVKRRVFAIGY